MGARHDRGPDGHAVGVSEFLLGKLIPYFCLGMIAMADRHGHRGLRLRRAVSRLVLGAGGRIVRVLVRDAAAGTVDLDVDQESIRGQPGGADLSAFLPAFELSGFIFEIDSMPWPIRLITYILPARYFVASLQTLFLAGDVPEVLVPNTLALLTIGAVLLTLLVRSHPAETGITSMWQRIRYLDREGVAGHVARSQEPRHPDRAAD